MIPPTTTGMMGAEIRWPKVGIFKGKTGVRTETARPGRDRSQCVVLVCVILRKRCLCPLLQLALQSQPSPQPSYTVLNKLYNTCTTSWYSVCHTLPLLWWTSKDDLTSANLVLTILPCFLAAGKSKGRGIFIPLLSSFDQCKWWDQGWLEYFIVSRFQNWSSVGGSQVTLRCLQR